MFVCVCIIYFRTQHLSFKFHICVICSVTLGYSSKFFSLFADFICSESIVTKCVPQSFITKRTHMESLLVADNIDFRLEYRVRTCAFHAAHTQCICVYLLSVSLSSLSLFFFLCCCCCCSLYTHSLIFDAFVSTLFMKRHVDFIHYRLYEYLCLCVLHFFVCVFICGGGVSCVYLCVLCVCFRICILYVRMISLRSPLYARFYSFVRSYHNGYFCCSI